MSTSFAKPAISRAVNEKSEAKSKKDILSIEFARENVDQGQRLLILGPFRKTFHFHFHYNNIIIATIIMTKPNQDPFPPIVTR